MKLSSYSTPCSLLLRHSLQLRGLPVRSLPRKRAAVTLVVAALLAALPRPATADDALQVPGSLRAAPQQQEEWYRCAGDSDCVLAVGFCECVAVNKNHTTDLQQLIAMQLRVRRVTETCMQAMSACSEPNRIPVACVSNRCVKPDEKKPLVPVEENVPVGRVTRE